MSPNKTFHFEQEGVEVNVPQPARKIKALSLPRQALKNMPAKPGGFQPGRVVINIALVYEDAPDEFLTEFDSPFELRVRYTPGDLRRAQQSNQPLQLAFWDGSDWVVFTPSKHNFELVPEERGEGGYGVVQLSHWGDPNIAWGP